MLKNTLLNKSVIKTVAEGLGELNQRVVYVGGAVVSFYINDPAADDVRPTKDIDISLEITSLTELIDIITQAQNNVLEFLKAEFKTIIESTRMKEAILGNLYSTTQTERLDIIIGKLKAITD